MPDTELTRPDGSTLQLSDYRGKKLVLFFYPKANTPGCTVEAKDFTALKDEFTAAGYSILGVSADSPKRQQNFITKQELAVDIASDEDTKFMESIGVWTEKKMYGKTFMGIVRSTFLINEDGIITHVWPKVRVKGHVQEVLELAQST